MTTPPIHPDRPAGARLPALVDDERRGALLARALPSTREPPADLAARAVAAAFAAPPSRAVDTFVAVAARFFVGAAACAAVAVVVLVRSSSTTAVDAVDTVVVEDVPVGAVGAVGDEPTWHAWRTSSTFATRASLTARTAP